MNSLYPVFLESKSEFHKCSYLVQKRSDTLEKEEGEKNEAKQEQLTACCVTRISRPSWLKAKFNVVVGSILIGQVHRE